MIKQDLTKGPVKKHNYMKTTFTNSQKKTKTVAEKVNETTAFQTQEKLTPAKQPKTKFKGNNKGNMSSRSTCINKIDKLEILKSGRLTERK